MKTAFSNRQSPITNHGAADIVLHAQGVAKTYQEGRLRTEVLREVNLSVARGETVAIIGASGGPGATRLAQSMTRQVLAALAVPVLPAPMLMIGGAVDRFQDGRLTDERTREQLSRVLRALEVWAARFATST